MEARASIWDALLAALWPFGSALRLCRKCGRRDEDGLCMPCYFGMFKIRWRTP